MNFFLGIILFLAGGATVIALEVSGVESFFDNIRAFLQSLPG